MMQLPFYSSLDEVRQAAQECRACSRANGRTQVVLGDGKPTSPLMIVAEYPSETDDRTGKPFTGPAGAYLDEIFLEAGIDRSDVYITNVVRCYATETGERNAPIRRAGIRERAACSVWMNLELQFVDPIVILAVGAVPAEAFLGAKFRLSEERGTWHRRDDGRWVIATLQPAYVLRIRTHDAQRADDAHLQIVADVRAAAERAGL